LFEPGDGPLDHVTALVAHRIQRRRAATPSAPPGPEGLLVGPLGDGVGDPPLAQQPPTGRVAVAPVSNQVRWTLARPTRSWPGHPDRIQQWFQLGALMALPGGDQHGQWPTVAVTSQVDLGGEPAAAVAQGLVQLSTGP
jgi:hypothetical protein